MIRNKSSRIAYLLRFLAAAGTGALSSTAAWSQEQQFLLTSPTFADNGFMSQKYAGKNAENPNCVGENVSPPLDWKNPPAGTRSYALIVHDQEGRYGLGVTHWLAYGIEGSTTNLPEGAGDGRFPSVVGGTNACNSRADWTAIVPTRWFAALLRRHDGMP